ncbi:MAG: hypothetical protein WDO70_07330 [Alphaproteobacteria bacterium]
MKPEIIEIDARKYTKLELTQGIETAIRALQKDIGSTAPLETFQMRPIHEKRLSLYGAGAEDIEICILNPDVPDHVPFTSLRGMHATRTGAMADWLNSALKPIFDNPSEPNEASLLVRNEQGRPARFVKVLHRNEI